MINKTINLFGIRKKVLIFRSKSIHDRYDVYMEAITKEQEDEIDNSIDEDNNLSFYKDNKLIAFGKSIILYGVVDFNNPIDIKQIQKYNLINDNKAIVHSGLDYDTGEVVRVDNQFRKYCTFNPVKWFKYNHLLLGKPERIICYKVKTNNKYARFNRKCDDDNY